MNTRTLLFFSLVGSLIGIFSDYCLLYDPLGRYLTLPKLAFLQDSSAERMWIGHFCGGFFIPLSLLALPALFKAVRANEDERLNISIAVIGATFIGVVYHLSLLPFRLWLDLEKFVLDSHLHVYQMLELICGVIILGLGIGWWKLAGRFTRVPAARWFANPALTYLVWVFGFLLSRDTGGMIWMMGMNLSVLICQMVLIFETSPRK